MCKVLNIFPASTDVKRPQKAISSTIVSEPVSKSYDEAVRVCMERVDAIVKESHRINQNYTDYDFYMSLNSGDVLDSLDTNADLKSEKPCVKRVRDIFEKPSFFLDGATGNDVRQGRLSNCWMAAAVSAVTNKSGLIEKLCPARNEEVGVYGFVFHRDGECKF